ncbi:MAG: GDSL-type esterase/lipase family protein [Actinomycetia bacterium]|nr:GDSL-type esterase/lipase family protein [Actinomycetes bacterium]
MSRRAMLLSAVLAVLMAVAIPVSALAPPPEQLPDGDTRPVIASAELLQPQSHNALLAADLRIEADDNDGILRYEYRWTQNVAGEILTTGVEDPTVSYTSVLPDTPYSLDVRAVDVHGWESEWQTAWTGTTPSPPVIVVAGDSIASGYTRQWFTGSATCRDDDYSYGSTVRDAVAAALPAAWSPRYVNIAFPGAGVSSVLNGGSDSCSDPHPSQVDDIARYTDQTTWNIVVMTAGINSTNWVDVVKALTKDTAFSLTDAGDKLVCEEAVTEHWNLAARRNDITARTAEVVEAIGTRTNASVFWTSYFSIDGSTLAPGWSPIGPECADEMDYALGELHGAIQAGLDPDVTWVDVENVSVSTQMWAGWPHPNPEGHRAIGLAIAEAIVAEEY